MKKRILSLFLALILSVTMLVPVQAESQTNVKVENVQGVASQLVTVSIKADAELDVSVCKLVVKYDSRLNLVKFENGSVFTTTYSTITGEENGTFTYVADIDVTAQKTSVKMAKDSVIFKLQFEIPASATTADEYTVSINNQLSSFSVTTSNEGTVGAKSIPCVSSAGIISIKSGSPCQTHTFGEATTVREQSYLHGGYSYKTCSVCGNIESTRTAPKATNAFTPLGTAIRHAGSPSGIGAHFKVDETAIKAVETAGFTVEVGIELSFGDRVETHVFYGANTPTKNATNYADGVISAAIENIPTQKKGTICAYIMIIDDSGAGRIERAYTSLNGNQSISIADVVSVMNFNKYNEASRDYLNAVANGFVE